MKLKMQKEKRKMKKSGEKFIAFAMELPCSIVIDFGTMRRHRIRGIFITNMKIWFEPLATGECIKNWIEKML